MMEINGLPGEMLMRLHHLLPPRDLKSAVLVDRMWREVGEHPSLWSWCVVTVRSRKDIRRLSIRRLRLVQSIHVEPGIHWEDGDWEILFQTVLKLPKLKKIDGLRSKNLKAVEPGLLARALTGLEEVDLSLTKLSHLQIITIFKHITQEDIKLRRLNLSSNLSAIEPEVLARVVNRLEEVGLWGGTKLNTLQITSILGHVMQDDSQLNKLNLSGNDLSAMDPEVLSRAFNRMKEVDLYLTKLSALQISSIFMHIIHEDTTLKKLDLSSNDLSGVDPVVSARALKRLEEMNLCCTNLGTLQITSILTHIMRDNAKLKKLDISSNDLSAVESEILAVALNRMEKAHFNKTKLQAPQITRILTHTMYEETNLKKLDISRNDLSAVEPEVLAKSFNRMEEVQFDKTNLTTLQMTSILTHIMQEDTNLQMLDLSGIKLSSVDSEVLARGVNRLKEAKLCHTMLSTVQMTAILRCVSQENTTLQKLDLSVRGLSTVDPEVLARAAIRLEEMDLRGSELSALHVTTILTHIAKKDTKLKKLQLCGIHLSATEPELLSRDVNIILAHVAQEKHMDINDLSTSTIEPEILSRAMYKLLLDQLES